MTPDDRRLGMGVRITRRDFLNGVATVVGSAAASHWSAAGGLDAQGSPAYPPAQTGLRGSHAGSFEALHTLRDGVFWKSAPAPRATGEEYDLVVVGGGISGLSAAWFYKQARPDARILILDNHDDFGGHAKRNEFTHEGRTYIGYGGTQSIDSPAPYSAVARALIDELGIDVERYAKVLDAALYKSLGLRSSVFFDRETFGVDRLVAGGMSDAAFVAAAPLPDVVRRDLQRLMTERHDPMPGLTSAEKKARLARMSYADFVTKYRKLDPGVLWLFHTRTQPLYGVGVDAVPAQDAFALGLPGFAAMGLDETPGAGQNLDSISHSGTEDYYFHFPDGNASIARLLVRRLIPAAIPGSTMDDVVTARANYGALDAAGSAVRIRLNSSVMRVRHTGPLGASQRVEVAYLENARLQTVTGRTAVLACWHTVIPAICPELPPAQKAALDYAIKVPLVYTNVLVRSWTSFQKLGVQRISMPSLWHTSASLDIPVSIGTYRHQTDPSQPIVLHLAKAACQPGLPARAQHRAGRAQLLSTSFETIERSIRDALSRALGAGGFDPARDVLAITVNRWPHGYAYQYNSLADDFWLNGGQPPCEVARTPYGRLAIANADAGAYAYTDAAIDHAHRAVQEVLSLS